MTDTFTSRRADQRFANAAVSGRKQEATRLLGYGIWFLQAAMDSGVSPAFLSDTAKGLRDELSDLEHAMATDLDNAHLETSDAKLDLSELDALIREIDGNARGNA